MNTRFKFLALSVIFSASVDAATSHIKIHKETECECIGTYTRISFLVKDKHLTNVRVVDSSSNDRCDKWHINTVKAVTFANHPDGVESIAVTGYTTKDKSITRERCLKEDEVELDSYWHVEKVSIDLRAINHAPSE